MINLIESIIEMASHLKTLNVHRDDTLSEETLDLMDLIEDKDQLIICLSDQETWDTQAYISFINEEEYDRVIEGDPMSEIIDHDRWISIGEKDY